MCFCSITKKFIFLYFRFKKFGAKNWFHNKEISISKSSITKMFDCTIKIWLFGNKYFCVWYKIWIFQITVAAIGKVTTGHAIPTVGQCLVVVGVSVKDGTIIFAAAKMPTTLTANLSDQCSPVILQRIHNENL